MALIITVVVAFHVDLVVRPIEVYDLNCFLSVKIVFLLFLVYRVVVEDGRALCI